MKRRHFIDHYRAPLSRLRERGWGRGPALAIATSFLSPAAHATGRKVCCRNGNRSPSPPAPLPQVGEGRKPSGRASVAASSTTVALPSPACGRGVGGEGRRSLLRRLFLSPAARAVGRKACRRNGMRPPSPPAPLPQVGEGGKPSGRASVAASSTTVALPSPACGRGVGGEGRRSLLRRRFLSPAARAVGRRRVVATACAHPHPRPLSHKWERGESRAVKEALPLHRPLQ